MLDRGVILKFIRNIDLVIQVSQVYFLFVFGLYGSWPTAAQTFGIS